MWKRRHLVLPPSPPSAPPRWPRDSRLPLLEAFASLTGQCRGVAGTAAGSTPTSTSSSSLTCSWCGAETSTAAALQSHIVNAHVRQWHRPRALEATGAAAPQTRQLAAAGGHTRSTAAAVGQTPVEAVRLAARTLALSASPPRGGGGGGGDGAEVAGDGECLPFVIVPSPPAATSSQPSAAIFVLGPDLALMNAGALAAAVADVTAHLRRLAATGRIRRGWIVACASDIQRLREIRGLVRAANATTDVGGEEPRTTAPAAAPAEATTAAAVVVGYMALPYGNHETLCDLLTAVKAGVELRSAAAVASTANSDTVGGDDADDSGGASSPETVGVVMAREVARPMTDDPDYALGSLFETVSVDGFPLLPKAFNDAAAAITTKGGRFELVRLPWALDHVGMLGRALGYKASSRPTRHTGDDVECDEASARLGAVFSAAIGAAFDAVLPKNARSHRC